MPAKRSRDDALTVALAIEAMRNRKRGVMLKNVRHMMTEWMKPFRFRRRGRSPVIDSETGTVIGDRLSESHARRLHKEAKRILKANEELARTYAGRLAELKAELASKPGSYLVPVRPKGSARETTPCLIAQWWPDGPLEARLTMYAPYGPDYQVSITSSDDPDGTFD